MIFIYAWAIYTLIRPDTPSTYYASRYFMPAVVPSVIILTCIVVNSRRKFLIIALLAIFTSLPFSLFQSVTTPYKNNIAMLTDALSTITQNSTVFVSPDDAYTNVVFMHNLRLLNNNKVYSCEDVNIVLSQSDEHAYVITTTAATDSSYKLLLQKNYCLYSDIVSFNGIYPLNINYSNQPVYIYQIR